MFEKNQIKCYNVIGKNVEFHRNEDYYDRKN